MRNAIVTSALLLSLLFVSCDITDEGGPTCDFCSSSIVTGFNAQWVNVDTVELYYCVQSSYFDMSGVRSGYMTALRIYEGPSTEGPWRQIFEQSNRTKTRFRVHTAYGDAMHYYRMELDLKISTGMLTLKGAMIATKRPYVHPKDLQSAMPNIEVGSWQYVGCPSACLSPERDRLFIASHNGMFVWMNTGNVQSTSKLMAYGDGDGRPVEWIDSSIIFTGSGLTHYDLSTWGKAFDWYGNGGFSVRKDDTTFIASLDKGANLFISYNYKTKRTLEFPWYEVPKTNLRHVSRSPSGKYFGAYSSLFRTAGKQEAWGILDERFQPVRTLDPFGNYVGTDPNDGTSPLTTRDPDDSFIQWGENDDRVYFWAHFSGQMELWTYSISENLFDQVTGYISNLYPGTYISSFYTLDIGFEAQVFDLVYSQIDTPNCIYDRQTNTLWLFFVYDKHRIIVRQAPPKP